MWKVFNFDGLLKKNNDFEDYIIRKWSRMLGCCGVILGQKGAVGGIISQTQLILGRHPTYFFITVLRMIMLIYIKTF